MFVSVPDRWGFLYYQGSPSKEAKLILCLLKSAKKTIYLS